MVSLAVVSFLGPVILRLWLFKHSCLHNFLDIFPWPCCYFHPNHTIILSNHNTVPGISRADISPRIKFNIRSKSFLLSRPTRIVSDFSYKKKNWTRVCTLIYISHAPIRSDHYSTFFLATRFNADNNNKQIYTQICV